VIHGKTGDQDGRTNDIE